MVTGKIYSGEFKLLPKLLITWNITVRPASSVMIIVVEDEILVRMTAVDLLTGAGFEVLEAGHAAEAIAVLDEHADRVQVVFTDVNMPGWMDGFELVRHVRLHWPWIGLLVTSGGTTPEPNSIPSGGRFLPKPYMDNTVLRHVREMSKAPRVGAGFDDRIA